MINDVADLVVNKYDGSLKAEHGTGRNMAPYVEFEWGSKAFDVMKRIKEIFDPQNILNPGVIFNDDPQCCFKNFKALPLLAPAEGASEEMTAAFAKLNKCIECGFCEVNCVSCGFTLSSRTRIALQREIAHLERSGENPQLLKILKDQYQYYGNETCAGDGLCSMSCPMGINVADLTHEIRRHNIIGTDLMTKTGRLLHKCGAPLWTPSMPKAYKVPESLKQSEAHLLKVVYFPSCINQTMGTDKASGGLKPLAEEMVELMNKAGYEVIFPDKMESLCCGTIWESKGMPDIADKKVRELEEALWEASEEGCYPVICDQSPCLHRMKQRMTRIQLYESAEFVWKFLKDRLAFTQTDTPVALHLTCSTKLMEIDGYVRQLASLCSADVLVPEGVSCCGFADDKGMTHPELNKYALRKLEGQIKEKGIETGYSNSRTCEMGLQTNSGIPYRSIIYLVNSCTAAKD